MNSYVDRTRPALSFVNIDIAVLNYAEANVHEILGTPAVSTALRRTILRRGMLKACGDVARGSWRQQPNNLALEVPATSSASFTPVSGTSTENCADNIGFA